MLKTYMKGICGVLAGGLMVFASTFGGSAVAAETTMKLGAATVNDVQTYALEQLAKRISERSNGRIKTEVYPGAQLGSNARMIEGLQFGTLEFYVGPYAYLVGVDPRFQVTDVPGVFRDIKHAQATLTDPEFANELLAIGEKKGIKGLGTLAYGSTAFATKFAGASVSDFKGKKLRVMASPMERNGVNLLGATAVPIDFSEVSTALQQGTIEGMKSSPIAFTSLRLSDLIDHITATELDVMAIGMFASKTWFDGLPTDLQQIVVEETKAIEPELWAYAIKDQEKAYKDWQAAGGTVHHLSEGEKQELAANMKKMATELLGDDKRTGTTFNKLLDVAAKH